MTNIAAIEVAELHRLTETAVIELALADIGFPQRIAALAPRYVFDENEVCEFFATPECRQRATAILRRPSRLVNA